ncbi:unnamed protein product [Caenorhabditis sp. 36 PRJEB53466]|nr:unnamed protein product [Caenorhabditis sp. 36 PRJEB53466]
MSEYSSVVDGISNADASYGTDTETIPDSIPEAPVREPPVPAGDRVQHFMPYPLRAPHHHLQLNPPNNAAENGEEEEEEDEEEKQRKRLEAEANRTPEVLAALEALARPGEGPAPAPKKEISTENKSAEEIVREVADNVHACRVCWEDFHFPKNQARLLGCGHSFCTRCVVNCSRPSLHSARDHVNGIRCPECRKVCKQAPASLPINFQLMQLLTALSLVKPANAEQDAEMPNYENFERLGNLLPSDQLSELSLDELYEYSKVLFNAIRLKSMHEHSKMAEGDICQHGVENEVMKLDDMERTLERFIKNMRSLCLGTAPRESFPFFPFRNLWERDQHFTDADWMREMVVFRQHQPPRADPRSEVYSMLNAQALREAAAGQQADPLRNLNTFREAHLRRERLMAFQRETARRNETLIGHLLQGSESERLRTRYQELVRMERVGVRLRPQEVADLAALREFHEGIESEQRRVREELTMAHLHLYDRPVIPRIQDDDELSTDSDDSSFTEEVEVRPQEAPVQMTLGEAATMVKMVGLVTSGARRTESRAWILPNNRQDVEQVIGDLLPEHQDPTAPTDYRQNSEVRRFAHANRVDSDQFLEILRDHCTKYAASLVEAPRLVRSRRQRPVPSDPFQALLSVIRKRAKQALRGHTLPAPIDLEENNLTMRLVINVATSLGVRDCLKDFLNPPADTPAVGAAPEAAGPSGAVVEREGGGGGEEEEEEDDDEESLDDEEEFEPSGTESDENEDDENSVWYRLNDDGRTMFCTLCRCQFPRYARQDHSSDLRHVARALSASVGLVE